MNEAVKKDIISLFDSVIDILESEEEKDLLELSELSDHVIHNASIFQDEYSVSAALMVYSIYKTFSRGRKEEVYKRIMPILKQARKMLIKDDIKNFKKKLKNIFKIIREIDEKVSIYVDELLDKAKLKKGAKIYEHGISVARVSEIVGISLWELSSYVGKTILPEHKEAVSLEKRLQIARSLFN
ncbi:MAG: hypothetical protein QXG86_00120 [Candidatus Woesearchaeota archaeon]